MVLTGTMRSIKVKSQAMRGWVAGGRVIGGDILGLQIVGVRRGSYYFGQPI